MKLELLEDLYLEGIAELYDGERRALRVFPKILKVVMLEELRERFRTHRQETKEHVKRLETIMGRRGGKGRTRKSQAMAGLLATTKELLKRPPADAQLLETALVAAAQRVEAYEVAAYACLHTFAKFLNFHEDLELLEQTYQEEQRMEGQFTAWLENLTFEAAESEAPVEAPPQPPSQGG